MSDAKAFRVVLAIPYEVIIFADSKKEAEDGVKNGGEDLFDSIIENSIPLVDSMKDLYDPDTTIVEEATPEDQLRILGEADPDIEAALSGEDGGDGEPEPGEDEDEDEEEDGDGE